MNVRVLAIIERQFYLMRGSVARIVPHFAWVAVDIVMWGYLSQYLNSIAGATVDFVPTLLGAVLLWDFFSRVMFGVTIAFFEDVWSRNFLNLFASPLTLGEYLAGLVISAIITSSLSLLAMLVVATAVFGLSLFTYGVFALPFALVLFVFGIALGIVAAALVLRLGPATEWFVWPIPALFVPFAGVFYPLTTLPPWMQWVGRLLPPSYVFDAMRAIVAGEAWSGLTLVWALALAVGYVLLACWIFAAVYHHAVRTGLIARYSAETVT